MFLDNIQNNFDQLRQPEVDPTGSGSKPEVDPNRKWVQTFFKNYQKFPLTSDVNFMFVISEKKKPEVDPNRKWVQTGSGPQP